MRNFKTEIQDAWRGYRAAQREQAQAPTAMEAIFASVAVGAARQRVRATLDEQRVWRKQTYLRRIVVCDNTVRMGMSVAGFGGLLLERMRPSWYRAQAAGKLIYARRNCLALKRIGRGDEIPVYLAKVLPEVQYLRALGRMHAEELRAMVMAQVTVIPSLG